MSRMHIVAALALLLANLVVGFPATAASGSPPGAAAMPLSAADRRFLTAYEAARVGDSAKLEQVARQLTDHPLAAYVEYWQLVPRLQSDPAVATAVEDFFARHAGTYVADRLRLDWSLALAARADFVGFEREAGRIVANTDDPQLRCYGALARYRSATGANPDAAVRDARRLLANTREPAGVGCLALSAALLADGRISVWERIRRLVERNQRATARRVAAEAVDPSGKPMNPKVLARAIERPANFLALPERPTPVQRELVTLALVVLARDSPDDAAKHAEALDRDLTPGERRIVWSRIGHMAALRVMPTANEWYRRGGAQDCTDVNGVNDEVLEWQVRSALRAGDWASVRSTIECMPASLRADPAWVYWYGRALHATGFAAEAREHFGAIASQFHFYGELAAEELGMPIVVPPRAPAPTAEELAPMAGNAGFARAQKFYELGLRPEGNREWNWQLRGMSDRQLLAAAEYARTQSLLDRMINTSDRTRGEFDFTQRFPVPFREALVRYAVPLGLEEAWVYGLMRQESRFIMDLRSHAGASGLMQLMPATAHYVARKLNTRDFTPARVNERDVNLQLGTAYLKMVLDDLEGDAVLATAAYNAGPNRPRAWRSTLVRPVEGAIFAETIPFDETRDYVKKVMSNTVLYARVLETRTPSLKARLGTIAPKPAGTTDLP